VGARRRLRAACTLEATCYEIGRALAVRAGGVGSMADLRWTPEALEKIKRVPFFVRPLAKKKAESEARARGLTEVTAALLEELREKQHR
jgi:hypothetical protein